jgi:hypothetical protein
MAFAETAQDRRVLEGINPFSVTLAEAVHAGDPLGISGGTWVLSASATVEQPIAIAAENGAVGETITAYTMAVVECVTTSSTYATVGEKVAVSDTGYYMAATADYPDVGFVASIGGLVTAIVFLCPCAAQLTVVRA